MPFCTRCKKENAPSNLEKIDGESICYSCLYENNRPFEIFPIGFVENELTRGQGFGLKGKRRQISKIRLFDSQRPFLYRLEEEKWITVVFYFHERGSIRSTFPRGIDGKKVGVFASRTPHRLSRIGITEVRLMKIEDTTLYVKNLDAINGSPVLDIKLGMKAFIK